MVVCIFNRACKSACGHVSDRCLGFGGCLDMRDITRSYVLILTWKRENLIML